MYKVYKTSPKGSVMRCPQTGKKCKGKGESQKKNGLLLCESPSYQRFGSNSIRPEIATNAVIHAFEGRTRSIQITILEAKESSGLIVSFSLMMRAAKELVAELKSIYKSQFIIHPL